MWHVQQLSAPDTETRKMCSFPQRVYSLEAGKTGLKLESTVKCLRGYIEIQSMCSISS